MINEVERAIMKSYCGETKLNEKALKLEGMSSKKVRIFLNSIVELIEKPKYLEIGVWKGSTFFSALYGNSLEYAAAIDNWCLFEGPRKEFFKNLSDVGLEFDFFDEDCFKIDKNKFKKKFNIYFYDGEHEIIDQELALTYFYDCLEDEFLYICDDWNFPKVPTGTTLGFEKTKLEIKKQWILPAKFNGDVDGWWNGLFVAVCKKIN